MKKLENVRRKEQAEKENLKKLTEEVLQRAKARKNINAEDLISEMVTEEKKEEPTRIGLSIIKEELFLKIINEFYAQMLTALKKKEHGKVCSIIIMVNDFKHPNTDFDD